MNQMDQLQQWIRDYNDRLRYVAYTYVRDYSRSEDIVQEAMVQAYLSIRQLRDPERPYPWLVRIVINLCLNANRKYRRERPTDSLPEQSGRSAEDIYLQFSRDKEVYAAIASLEEKYRTPIILYYFEEMTVKDIAYALQLSPGAVKTRLARGREQLKPALTREEPVELGDTYPSSKPTYLHADQERTTEAVMAKLSELQKTRHVRPVRRRARKLGLITATAVVAALCVLGAAGYFNPAMAHALSKVPVVGSLFSQAGDAGLRTVSKLGLTSKVHASETLDGVTFNISEMMYDGARMSMVLTRETSDGSNPPLKEWSDAATEETIAFWKEQGKEVRMIEVRANGRRLNVTTALTSDILHNNSSILTVQPSVAETYKTSFDLPDAFNLEVVIRDAAIGRYFTLSLPVKKTTRQTIVLASEETKSYNGLEMRMNKLEMTEATLQLEVRLNGKAIAELGDSLMYDLQNERGEFAALMGGSGSPGADSGTYMNTAEFAPFPSLPKTVTVKPYLLKGKGKAYIPELAFTLQVNE